MEKCKWNFKMFGYYVRLTESNRFIILGKREEQWVEVVVFNWL